MHLTNYSVNKHNKNFERHDGADRGSKRSILSFLSYLKSAGCNTGLLWRQITVCLRLLIYLTSCCVLVTDSFLCQQLSIGLIGYKSLCLVIIYSVVSRLHIWDIEAYLTEAVLLLGYIVFYHVNNLIEEMFDKLLQFQVVD